MDLLQLHPAAMARLQALKARPFAQRFQELVELLAQPTTELSRAMHASQVAAMLDSPDDHAERTAPATLAVMRTEVDRLGERLRPLGRGLLPALERHCSGAGGSRQRRHFEAAAALLYQHEAALSLLAMSCSFIFEGSIPATASALRSLADGYAAVLPAVLPLMHSVQQQCQPSRDARMLTGIVMHHCDVLWRTVGCFAAARGGQEWPRLEAALPASLAVPWVRELLTWAELGGPYDLDLAATVAMLGRLLFAHKPLQAALEGDLELQRQLLRPLLRLLFPPPAAPASLGWVGDVENGAMMLCGPCIAPAVRDHIASPEGLRTLQTAAQILQQPLPELAAMQTAGPEQLEDAQHAVSKHTARLRAFARLLGAALEESPPGQRAPIAACLMAEGQAAAVAAARGWRAMLGAPGVDSESLNHDIVEACKAIAIASLALEPKLLHGRRGLQAAHSGLHSTLCFLWQLEQLRKQAAEGGPQVAGVMSIAGGATAAMYPLSLALAVAVDEASGSAAAASSSPGPAEQLRLVWQSHAACCCLLQGMPEETVAQQAALLNFCNLLSMLLRAAVNLAQRCPSDAQAEVQRLLDSVCLAHLAVAKHRQQRSGGTTGAALRLLVLDPCLTSQPELQAAFEAGGGLPLYIQTIRSICEGPLPYDTASLVQMLGLQLAPPHASPAAAAELVTSGLHRLLAKGGAAARYEGQCARELGAALRKLARMALLTLGQAGSEARRTGAAPAIEQPFVALDTTIQDSMHGLRLRLTPAVLDAAEPLARALQQLWEQQRQVPVRQAEAHVRMARAAALRRCANLLCPNIATGAPLKAKRCAGCKAVRYCCAACQAEDWKPGGHRHACKLLQAEGGGS